MGLLEKIMKNLYGVNHRLTCCIATIGYYAHPSNVASNALTGFAIGLERRVDDLCIPQLSKPTV